MAQTYDDKTTNYFAAARVEIEPLLVPKAARLLEVGCGAGQTLRWLKETGRVERGWGLELFEAAAEAARAHFDVVQVGDAEKLIDHAYEGMQFDLVMCLDVLEHMIDPWRFVDKLQHFVAPGGKLILSVPNIRCLQVLLPLLVLGRWRYTHDGILDRTHLRFFTRESAIELATPPQLRFEQCLPHVWPRTRLARFNKLTFGAFSSLAAKQFVVSSVRVA
jgi:2-polyprenyl-3-methyl-5-hydroxy-6-metoxy-1,4-benzoquinol methylase